MAAPDRLKEAEGKDDLFAEAEQLSRPLHTIQHLVSAALNHKKYLVNNIFQLEVTVVSICKNFGIENSHQVTLGSAHTGMTGM